MIAGSRMLFVAHSGQVSGAEKVMLDLVIKGIETGREVVVACPAGPLIEQLPAGCGHLPIPALGLSGQRGAARGVEGLHMLWRWIQAGHALSPLARCRGTRTVVNSLIALPAVRLARPPGGATWLIHDTMTSRQQRAVTRLGRPAIRFAVATSEAAAAPQRAIGIRVVVAKNGVREADPQFVHVPQSRPVIGMLALLTPWKGHRVLLEAVSRIAGVDVEFAGSHFPGDEDYVAQLKDRANQPDLRGRVRFLGHVEPQSALSRWDIAISASTLPEAGPLSVLEAMAHGVPVIGTDHGGTGEFLRDGAGILVRPGDSAGLATAIERLLAEPDTRTAIAYVARQRVADEHDIQMTLPAQLEALLS